MAYAGAWAYAVGGDARRGGGRETRAERAERARAGTGRDWRGGENGTGRRQRVDWTRVSEGSRKTGRVRRMHERTG